MDSFFTSKVGKFQVSYLNKKEFQTIRNETFTNRCYAFSSMNKRPRIIDVGAHVGLATLYFKSRYPLAEILAFEPNPELFELLKYNVEQNGIKGVKLYNVAVSNKSGKADLYVDGTGDKWYSTGSLIEGHRQGDKKLATIQVATVMLGKYIEQSVDLLKIDAEGSELRILGSIDNKLKLVNEVIVEVHDTGKAKLSKVLKALSSKGLQVEIEEDRKDSRQGLSLVRATRGK